MSPDLILNTLMAAERLLLGRGRKQFSEELGARAFDDCADAVVRPKPDDSPARQDLQRDDARRNATPEGTVTARFRWD